MLLTPNHLFTRKILRPLKQTYYICVRIFTRASSLLFPYKIIIPALESYWLEIWAHPVLQPSYFCPIVCNIHIYYAGLPCLLLHLFFPSLTTLHFSNWTASQEWWFTCKRHHVSKAVEKWLVEIRDILFALHSTQSIGKHYRRLFLRICISRY